VTVRPLTLQNPPEYLMVIFRETPPREISPREEKAHAAGKGEKYSEKDRHIADLEGELQQAR
jgi:hypothetical protein